jgi:hypothetical protein
MKNIYLFLIWLAPLVVSSQEKTTFSFNAKNQDISKVLELLERKFDVRFSYKNKAIDNKQISLTVKEAYLNDILFIIENKLNLKFEKLSKRYFIIKKKKITLNDVQQLNSIVLENYLAKGISKNDNGSYKIVPKNLEILAGLTEADVLESIQQLPGIFSPNETATGLVVRGGSTDQNRLIWDGINIYHNGHLFGMISAFNPNITRQVTVYNKGTNPRFGERVSSVIDIETNHKILRDIKTSFGLNGLSADAFIEVPIIKDKLSVETSVRRSYTELYESFTFDKLAEKVFQNTKIVDTDNTNNDFYFMDFNTKINYKINDYNKLSISTLFIDNRLDYLVKDLNTNQTFNDILQLQNQGYSINWHKEWSKRVSHTIKANLSKYKLNYNFITALDEVISDFDKRNVVYDSGLALETKIRLNNFDNLYLGYEYSLKDVSYAFLKTDDLAFILDSDQTIINTHSFYSNYNYAFQDVLDINAGFRLNYYSELSDFKFEPRLIISKNLLKNFTVQLTGEIKNQVISQIDETILSDLSLENRLWRLADGDTFPVINSNQVSVGVLYNKNEWSFDIDHYYKNIDGLTTLSLGFLNPDGTSFYNGKQQIRGVDVYVQRKLNFFNAWMSYSYIDINNKFDDLNGNNYFTARNEIKHAVTASIAYKNKNFQLAVSWNWRNGKPFTKAILQDDGTYIFDGINTENLEDYHRLDISSTYEFKFSKRKNAVNGKVGFSIKNIYNRNNQLSREYTGNNSLNDPIKVIDKFSLGFTPNVLFRVSF